MNIPKKPFVLIALFMSTQNVATGQQIAFPFPTSKLVDPHTVTMTLATQDQNNTLSILSEDSQTASGFMIATLIAKPERSSEFGRIGNVMISKTEGLAQSTLIEARCSVLATPAHLPDGRLQVKVKQNGNCSDLLPAGNKVDGTYTQIAPI